MPACAGKGDASFCSVDCACGQDHWAAEIICLDDEMNTPEEWTFTSKPLSPNTDCQKLVESGFKGVLQKARLELAWDSGRNGPCEGTWPIGRVDLRPLAEGNTFTSGSESGSLITVQYSEDIVLTNNVNEGRVEFN